MEAYSVLMAVYHKEKAEYLQKAIDSMMMQTIPPDEFVLVCDGPLTKPLDAVIDNCCTRYRNRLRVVRLDENMGLGAALNVGVQHCRHELIARMDSDDIAVRDRMEKQLAELRAYPSVSAVGGQIAEFYDDPGRITAYRKVPTGEQEIREFIRYRNPMNHVTVVLRKSHILRVGNYQDVPGFEDYFLWASLIAKGYQMRNIKDVCCIVRANAGMYSRRGGIAYFQNTWRIERFLLDQKIISLWQFCKNVAIRFAGTVLLPPELRRVVFVHFLRKRDLHSAADETCITKPAECQFVRNEKYESIAPQP